VAEAQIGSLRAACWVRCGRFLNQRLRLRRREGLSTMHAPPWRVPAGGPCARDESSAPREACPRPILQGWGTGEAALVLHARPARMHSPRRPIWGGSRNVAKSGAPINACGHKKAGLDAKV